MKFHEYANIYRMLPNVDLAKMAENIKERGQLLPITSYEGKILDGRNRYRACELAGVEPRIEEYTGDDPLGLIASLNDHRRHDTENERALVGARMANLKKGGAGGSTVSDSSMETSQPAITIERAAELSGSTPASIKRAKPIVQSGIQELQDMVDGGEVSIRAGSEVAKLPKEEQRKAVSGGVAGVKDAAKKCKQSSESLDATSGSSLLISSSRTPTSDKMPKFIPDDAARLWTLARTDLDKILPTDKSLKTIMREVIAYAEERISKTKQTA